LIDWLIDWLMFSDLSDETGPRNCQSVRRVYHVAARPAIQVSQPLASPLTSGSSRRRRRLPRPVLGRTETVFDSSWVKASDAVVLGRHTDLRRKRLVEMSHPPELWNLFSLSLSSLLTCKWPPPKNSINIQQQVNNCSPSGVVNCYAFSIYGVDWL